MAERVFIALGSNLGDRESYLHFARRRLGRLPDTALLHESSIEETAPIGPGAQSPYLNQMLLLRSDLSPHALLKQCLEIEQQAGRTRDVRWGPRTLDLDLVRYGDLAVREPDLVLPHPEIGNRGFWQRQIAELELNGRS